MSTTPSSASATVPLRVRVSFAHAVAHRLAIAHDLEVLHIKGPAVHSTLAVPRRSGGDADVLVRPTHVEPFLRTLYAHGWTLLTSFEKGSPFAHAAAVSHPLWGQLDVHRLFPGITADPAVAFARFWDGHLTEDIAGIDCPVPDLTAQLLLVVLNAARTGPSGRVEVDRVWRVAAAGERTEVQSLARDLGAEVAFSAAVGDLDRHRGADGYDLWKAVSQGGTRFEEWKARVRAAPDRLAAVRTALRSAAVNTEHLTILLGRRPTRPEIIREFFARPVRGVREQVRAVVRRRRR